MAEDEANPMSDVFSFKDGDKNITLRYDLSSPLARFYAQNNQELPSIFKRYQIQNVFRNEKAGNGRYREFMQADFDIVGNVNPAQANAELCNLISSTLSDCGLNKDQFISAFGIALSQSSGSMEFLNDGSWTKRSHVGQAAQNGLKCAVLALEGFKGPKEAFEGKWGYLNSFVSGGDTKKALSALGDNFETLNLGVKPYPSCRYSHAAIDGLLELKSEIGFQFDELEDIEIGLSNTALNIIGVPLEEKRNPKNIVDGQFSMPFCAAIAAKNGSFVWDDYKNSLTDKDTLSLCKRIKTTHDKKAEECSPEYMSANVKIKVNGKDHERFIKIPKGDPENFMTQDEFIEKFDGLVEPYLTPKKSDELKNFMLKLDNANSIGSLFELSN